MYPRLTNGATHEAPKKRKRTQVPLNNVLTGAEEEEDGNEDSLEQVTKKLKLYEACRSVVEGSGVSDQAGGFVRVKIYFYVFIVCESCVRSNGSAKN